MTIPLRVLLTRIIGPCTFGHEPLVYERAPDGTLFLVCPRCRLARAVRLVTG